MFTVFSYKRHDWTEQNFQVVIRKGNLMQETAVITMQFNMWKGGMDFFFLINELNTSFSGDLCCAYLIVCSVS